MLQTFKFENSNVRTVDIDGQIFFVGNDIAKTLGYARPYDAISAHCRYTAKYSIPHPQSINKKIEVSVIPESDVYRLVVKSQLPQAEKFERWVFDEVLPSIRKHGGYLTPEKVEEALINPDTMIQLCIQLKQERTEKDKLAAQIKKNEPYTKFGLAIAETSAAIKIGDYAKVLANDGIIIGQNQLFEWFRKNGYLCRDKAYYNRPKQAYINSGLFRVKQSKFTAGDKEKITFTPLLTGKGQKYFYEKLRSA